VVVKGLWGRSWIGFRHEDHALGACWKAPGETQGAINAIARMTAGLEAIAWPSSSLDDRRNKRVLQCPFSGYLPDSVSLAMHMYVIENPHTHGLTRVQSSDLLDDVNDHRLSTTGRRRRQVWPATC